MADCALFEEPNMSDDARKEKIDALPVTDIEINEASDGSGLARTRIKIATLFFELEHANRVADALDEAVWLDAPAGKVRKRQMGIT
jgi:hypothetical protein